MITPSIRTLIEHLNLPRPLAAEVKGYLTAGRAQLEAHPVGAARVAECYHPPRTWDIRMHVLNAAIGGYGVEGFQTGKGEQVEYVNMGDTYTPTIVRFRGHYRVACWGDIAERHGAE